MSTHENLIGTILGSYRLTRVLGVGGMGAVYLGEHPEIESKVAIKLLLPEFVQRDEIVRRFLDEARAVNRIGHPGIVRIHDSAHHETLGVYLVMEYLEGETLFDLQSRTGTLEPGWVCRLLQQAASALAASHQMGIVHRDLKPANLFLVQDPEVPGGARVKVLDFGIAKLVEEHDPMSGGTATGAFLGSPMFMSPEQCIDSKDVDHRTDIYALGAIGYNALSGRYPFEAESIGRLILMHRSEKPCPLRQINPAVPEALQAVLDRALEIDRERRYQSMEELRQALLEVLGQPVGARPAGDASKDVPTTGATMLPDADLLQQLNAIRPAASDAATGPARTSGTLLPDTALLDQLKAAKAGEPVATHPNTTLSRAAGEQMRTEAPAVSRSLLLRVGIGLSALAVTVVGALLLARLLSSSPGERPPASTSRSAASSASRPAAQKPASRPVTTAPDVGVIRQLTLRLEVTPPSARVLLDGRPLEGREVQLPADGRERRLTITAEGYQLQEQSFKADGDRTLRIELTRERPTRVGAPPLVKGSRARRRPAPKASRKKPARKKPYFNEL